MKKVLKIISGVVALAALSSCSMNHHNSGNVMAKNGMTMEQCMMMNGKMRRDMTMNGMMHRNPAENMGCSMMSGNSNMPMKKGGKMMNMQQMQQMQQQQQQNMNQ